MSTISISANLSKIVACYDVMVKKVREMLRGLGEEGESRKICKHANR